MNKKENENASREMFESEWERKKREFSFLAIVICTIDRFRTVLALLAESWIERVVSMYVHICKRRLYMKPLPKKENHCLMACVRRSFPVYILL